MTTTRITVVSAGDQWAVRNDGLLVLKEPNKRVAVAEARRLAKRTGAILKIQNRHGAWQRTHTY